MRKKLAIVYVVCLVLLLGYVTRHPVGFQKTYSLLPAASYPPIPGDRPGHSLDVAGLLGSTSYDEERPFVWAILPHERYRQAIVEGAGNCSNRSFGLAYLLGKSEIDYQLVSFLDRERLLDGWGHTVVRTRYRYEGEERVGIVDLQEGGLPRSGERFLDLTDLLRGKPDHVVIELLHESKGTRSTMYGDLLDDGAVAYTPSSEVMRYFRFIDAIYIPLGNEKIEKYLYDGIAVILGTFPHLYTNKYYYLFEIHRPEMVILRTALWTIRSAIFIVPLIVVSGLWGLRNISSERRL